MNGEHPGFTCGLLRQTRLRLGSLVCSIPEPLADDNIGLATKIVSSHINQTRGMLFTNLMVHNRAFEGDEWVREEHGQKKIDFVVAPTRRCRVVWRRSYQGRGTNQKGEGSAYGE